MIAYRSALVQCIGLIIEGMQKISNDDDIEQSQRMMSHLVPLLFERIYDINSFTRSIVCKTLYHLVEIQAIPLEKYTSLMELAYDRLNDKTAMVRKSALQLLTQLVDYNPFSPHLNMGYYDERRTQLEEDLNNHRNQLFEWFKNNCQENEREVLMGKSSEEQFDFFLTQSVYVDDEETQNFIKQIHLIDQGIQFVSLCHKTVLKIMALLKSKTNTDVVESLFFLTRAIDFSVNDSAKSFQR